MPPTSYFGAMRLKGIFLLLASLAWFTAHSQERVAVAHGSGIGIANLADSTYQDILDIAAILPAGQTDSITVLDLVSSGDSLHVLFHCECSQSGDSAEYSLGRLSMSVNQPDSFNLVMRTYGPIGPISGSLSLPNREFVIGNPDRSITFFAWGLGFGYQIGVNSLARSMHVAYTGDGTSVVLITGTADRTVDVRRYTTDFPYQFIDIYPYPSSIQLRSVYALEGTDRVALVGFGSPCIEALDPATRDIDYIDACGDTADDSFEFEPGFLREEQYAPQGSGGVDYMFGVSGDSNGLYSTYERRVIFNLPANRPVQRVVKVKAKLSASQPERVAQDRLVLKRIDGGWAVEADFDFEAIALFNYLGQRVYGAHGIQRSADPPMIPAGSLQVGVYVVQARKRDGRHFTRVVYLTQ